MSSLTVFEAAQPRDAVYSLLAISRDTAPFAELQIVSQEGNEEAIIMSTVSSFLERKPFRVDYSRPYSDICKDFVAFCIQVSGKSDPSRALDILCRPWSPDPKITSSGIIHNKPTLYKDLAKQKGREALWETRKEKYERRVDRKPATKEDKKTAKLEVDTRSMEQYWTDVIEDYRGPFREKATVVSGEPLHFWRNVEPYLPRNTGRSGEAIYKIVAEMMPGFKSTEEDDVDATKDMVLPSWVSKISGASFALYRSPGMNDGTKIGRQNADSLVGPPQDGHKTYSAAQNTKVDYSRLKFRKRPGLRGSTQQGYHSLYTNGFILAKVEAITEPSRRGGIPKTWIELADWEDAIDGKTEPPAEFWRTLVADRGKDHRNPPYYYATACKESIRKGGLRGGSVDTDALISKEKNSIIAEFCRRVQAVVWNRRLIKTAISSMPEEGAEPMKALGLASEEVRKGDLVCILYGCTVPVILRPTSKKKESLKAEDVQDNIEFMRAAISACEDACFRRNRYKKRLQREKDDDNPDWETEVKEEREAVNEQMREWKTRRDEAADQEKRDKQKQKQWKLAADDRSKRRKTSHTVDPKIAQGNQALNRSQTMPAKTWASPSVPAHDKFEPPGDGHAVGDGSNTAGQVEESQVGESLSEAEKANKEKQKQLQKEDQLTYYKFIGEAYIHGMMDGEAMRLQINESWSMPKRTFEIR